MFYLFLNCIHMPTTLFEKQPLRRSGERSAQAMQSLQQESYTRVYNLGGVTHASEAFVFYGSGSSIGPPQEAP